MPESLPRLIDKVIWLDCYKGNADEYDIIGNDVLALWSLQGVEQES